MTHTVVLHTVVCMHVDRLSVTLDPKLGAAARKAAKLAKISLSAWIAEAAADRVRNEALGRALDAWEAEAGAFTDEELAAASDALKPASRSKARRR